MLNIPPVTAQFSGLTTQIIELDEPDSKCELTLYALEQAEGIQLTMTYASNLFREERATEMLAQFECLCRQIVNDPEWPIERYSLLTERSAAVLPDPGMPLRQARDPLLQPVHVMFRQRRRNVQRLLRSSIAMMPNTRIAIWMNAATDWPRR